MRGPGFSCMYFLPHSFFSVPSPQSLFARQQPSPAHNTVHVRGEEDFLLCFYLVGALILETTPLPTVLPPSRRLNFWPTSKATGYCKFSWRVALSPGITISVPSIKKISPVTSEEGPVRRAAEDGNHRHEKQTSNQRNQNLISWVLWRTPFEAGKKKKRKGI
mmetsp:Transcript_44791/g.90480  ORF Transcript_44791/g.90480 Transcript_44791/m.90480 type:complete len:162 (-) Transcript_44791:2-487(-)